MGTITKNDHLVDSNEVEEKTTLSRTTIWRLEKSKSFPARIRISKNRVAWSLIEVEAWIDSKKNVKNSTSDQEVA